MILIYWLKKLAVGQWSKVPRSKPPKTRLGKPYPPNDAVQVLHFSGIPNPLLFCVLNRALP